MRVDRPGNERLHCARIPFQTAQGEVKQGETEVGPTSCCYTNVEEARRTVRAEVYTPTHADLQCVCV